MEITKQAIQKASLAQCVTYVRLLGIEYQGQNAKKLKEILSGKLVDGKLTIPGGEDNQNEGSKPPQKPAVAKKGPVIIKKAEKKPTKAKPAPKKALKSAKEKGETKTAKALALFKKGWSAREVADELKMHISFAHTVKAKLKKK